MDRVKSVWNAFRAEDDRLETTDSYPHQYSPVTSYGTRPDRVMIRGSNERSVIASVLTRISIDVAALSLRHVKTDEKQRFTDDIDSGLNRCLNFEANLDQGPRAFRQDIVMTMLDSSEACIVPVDVVKEVGSGKIIDILTLRVGRVTQWFPRHVRVSLYNQERMQREEVTLPKTMVALPDNPLYTVMNGPNSTLNRLIRKLNLLDVVDEASSSGKLDLIIQLPYTVRGDVKKAQVNARREEIESQLAGSKYGIAWADATEKITQLNRPVENNLLTQVEFLMKMLYSQLGLTEGVMDGSASEEEMLNYMNRTVKPIAESITEAMIRSFLGLEAWADGERVRYYEDPFRLVPVGQMADIADKFTRNEILTANEVRAFMGIEPHDDPKADQLLNSNINPTGMTVSADGTVVPNPAEPVDEDADPEDDPLKSVADALDEVFEDLGVPG